MRIVRIIIAKKYLLCNGEKKLVGGIFIRGTAITAAIIAETQVTSAGIPRRARNDRGCSWND